MSSRRSRRETLVRVADIKTKLARRDVAAQRQLLADAEALASARQDLLAGTGLAGGSPTALEQSTQLRLLRAASVAEAEAHVRLAVLASDSALRAWTEARRQQKLMENLRDRAVEEAVVERHRVEQREADDLASTRRADW